jgi:hypothetical protein
MALSKNNPLSYANQDPSATAKTIHGDIVFAGTGGNTTIDPSVHPFFWTEGNFATANSTSITGQIYANGKVIIQNGTTINAAIVNTGVLHFIGTPQLSQGYEYLLHG